MALDPEAGARLRAYMEPRIGKVQPWSERHGIGRDTIYALWRGREPQPDTLARIADAVGITYDQLLRVRAGLEEPAPDSAHTEGAGSIVEAIDRQTAMLERVLTALLQRTPDPEAVASLQAWAEAQGPTPSQRHATTGR